MIRKRHLRKKRGKPWNSESSDRANRSRWNADRERRDAEEPERLRELAEMAAVNMPHREGDALGALQWHDFRTGQVRRWTVRIGDRADRVTLAAADGRCTGSHGWSWVMTHLRGFLAGRK